MKLPVKISTREEYNLCKEKGHEPLCDVLFFCMDIKLRLELQRELFPFQSPENDVKFYKWCWENKPKFCEEIGQEILGYAAIHISHILTKGAFTEARYDGRNVNILSAKSHNKWEFATDSEKQNMKIYYNNQYIIELLKKDYVTYYKNQNI